MQKFKVNGQSVSKVEWKQTDRRTEVIALPPSPMRSAKRDVKLFCTTVLLAVLYNAVRSEPRQRPAVTAGVHHPAVDSRQYGATRLADDSTAKMLEQVRQATERGYRETLTQLLLLLLLRTRRL